MTGIVVGDIEVEPEFETAFPFSPGKKFKINGRVYVVSKTTTTPDPGNVYGQRNVHTLTVANP